MSWQWVAVVALTAVWTLGFHAVNTWKEVQYGRMMPDDLVRDWAERGTR